MKRSFLFLALGAAGLALGAGTALGQLPPLQLPQASPEASVSQTVGLTDITITYHRPAVAKRTVWGDLVPYGQVWRAGANENTTIEFSTPVTIGGKKIPAGTYGLHMIPTDKGDWTIILSSVSSAWGSFSYDEKEDVVRVPVAALRFFPQPQQVHPDDHYHLEGRATADAEGSGKSSATDKATAARNRQRRLVWVQDGNFLRAVPVVLGLSDNHHAELLGGDLQEGQVVVTGVEPLVSSFAGR